MKALTYSLFALAMFLALAITPSFSAEFCVVALVSIFIVGALLSKTRPGILCANVAGFLGSANSDVTDNVGEWQQFVLHRNARGNNTGSTLFGLMSQLASEEADAQIYNWWEKDPVRRNFYSTASRTDSDTTISFDDNGTVPVTDIWVFLRLGSILLNDRTGERIRVAATPTTTTVTITRGVQGSTAAAVNDNDLWTLITYAKANGAVPTRAVYTQPTSYQNYIQTFNATASVENAYKAGILRTDLEGPQMEAQLDALEQISNDIEYAYFFGVKELVTTSEGATYYTGGLKNAIDAAGLTNNVLNGNGTNGVGLGAFTDWIEACMTQGSENKIFFGGPKSYGAISKYCNSNSGGYRINQGDNNTVFGIAIQTITTPHGELSMASHPLFKTSLAFNDWGFIVDLGLVKQKIMEPLFFEEYAPTNGQDSWQGQFRAKLGLKQKFPEAFAYLYDFSQINAD